MHGPAVSSEGISVEQSGTPGPSTHSSSAVRFAYWALAFFYILAVAHRPFAVTPESMYDDGLYMKQALEIASGHWLGHYNNLTLAKGAGFPIFLALNYMLGLPVGLALCLSYVAAVSYFCRTLRCFVRSQVARVALFASLLFVPPLASSITTFVERDFFYAAIVLGFFSAAIDLSCVAQTPTARGRAILLAGALGGWAWLTREEGVWLVPALATLVVSTILKSPRRNRVDAARRWALALAIGLGTVLAVATTNRIAYGRFSVAEITSSAFQSAMTALERGAYPDWRPYVPVPARARARLYAVSPSFQKLQAALDPPGSLNGWEHEGCVPLPQTCGDIAGGWFMWAVRSAVQDAGLYASARTAEAYYSDVASEVGAACREGRLECARWMPPLVPPMTVTQVRDLPGIVLRSAEAVAMIDPVETGWSVSRPPRDLEPRFVELVGDTPFGPGRIVTLKASYEGSGAEAITVHGGTSARIVEFSPPSPVSNTPGQDSKSPVEFSATVGCLAEPCTIGFSGPDNSEAMVTLGRRRQSDPIELGQGTIRLVDYQSSSYTLRTRWANAFNKALPWLEHGYTLLFVLGTLSFLAIAFDAVRRRTMSLGFLVALALGVAVASRIALIALVEAASFPAINDEYLAPAFPLSIGFSALAIAMALARWRPSRQGGNTRDELPDREGGLDHLRACTKAEL